VDAAVWIQSNLAEIGVNATVNKMTDADFFGKLNAHELPLFIHDWYSWGNDPAYQLTFGQASGVHERGATAHR
jgi:ABC-type transport system substrate-binding protein